MLLRSLDLVIQERFETLARIEFVEPGLQERPE